MRADVLKDTLRISSLPGGMPSAYLAEPAQAGFFPGVVFIPRDFVIAGSGPEKDFTVHPVRLVQPPVGQAGDARIDLQIRRTSATKPIQQSTRMLQRTSGRGPRLSLSLIRRFQDEPDDGGNPQARIQVQLL
jgi:hypothetical protein